MLCNTNDEVAIYLACNVMPKFFKMLIIIKFSKKLALINAKQDEHHIITLNTVNSWDQFETTITKCKLFFVIVIKFVNIFQHMKKSLFEKVNRE